MHIISSKTLLFIRALKSRTVSRTSKTISKWTGLRSLDLSSSLATSLPESIGELLHLRSLDLSSSRHLEVLPKSITKLVNLQTLNLHSCSSLKQVPDNVSKLVDLSTLDIAECNALSCMPAGIGMLTSLHRLGKFVIGAQASSTSKQCFNGLEDLQKLNNLKGSLKIEIAVLKNAKFAKEEHGGGAYLRNKEHLETIVIYFRRGMEYGSKESEQALLEEMQPHHDVKTLKLKGYHGETIPRWSGRGNNSALFDLPKLVTLHIQDCSELVYLPWQIGKLPHLKILKISDLSNLDYFMGADSDTLVLAEGSSFFPKLDDLNIYRLPKLKGWWRRSDSGSLVVKPTDGGRSGEPHLEWVSSPCFPLLKNLTIQHCEKMIFVPVCPRFEHLKIYDSRRKMEWIEIGCIPHHQPSSSSPSYSKSRTLQISNLEWLRSMPIEYSQFLAEISIRSEERLENLGEVKELFPACLLSSLRSLNIISCPKLMSMGGWLEHLSALECLRINSCPNLQLRGMSWHNLAGSLQSLYLIEFEEMEELPEGMQYCTSLVFLVLWKWRKLKSLPKWMPKLTSLQKLELRGCSETLKERCQQPNEDWPFIRHISSLVFW